MGTYAISIDWMEEFKQDYDKWENVGRRVSEENCTHKTQDNSDKENRETNLRYSGYCEECEVSEDNCEPMMNYGYPLETNPDEDKVLEVTQRTCLTVMHNTETDEYFLALCGGGMDLSQSIALAYIILENWIPEDMIREICTQPNLSVCEKDYKLLANKVIEQLKTYADNFKTKSQEWKEKIKELK